MSKEEKQTKAKLTRIQETKIECARILFGCDLCGGIEKEELE